MLPNPLEVSIRARKPVPKEILLVLPFSLPSPWAATVMGDVLYQR